MKAKKNQKRRSATKTTGAGRTERAHGRISELRRRLARAIPTPLCELDHRNAWELLVATILSAQSTDRRVNLVTPELFRRYPGPSALANAPRGEVERLVKSTGFFRNKTRAIQEASRILAQKHGGEVPREMAAALELPGVARKTANVVLGTAYGIPTGIAVDTHAARVAQRLELSTESDPEKIERDLCGIIPRSSWIATSHRLILHGRYVCIARAPACARCPLNELCPAREAEPQEAWTERARFERELVDSRGESRG